MSGDYEHPEYSADFGEDLSEIMNTGYPAGRYDHYHPELVYQTPAGDAIDRVLGSVTMQSLLRDMLCTFQAVPLADGHPRLWLICGMAHRALAEILSSIADIPIESDGTGERLELDVKYYWPTTQPEQASDHTVIKYFDKDGSVSYIDAVYPLLWGGANFSQTSRVQDLIYFRRYESERELDMKLSAELNLHTYYQHTKRAVWQHPMLIDTRSHEDVVALKKILNAGRGSTSGGHQLSADTVAQITERWEAPIWSYVFEADPSSTPIRYTTPYYEEIPRGQMYKSGKPEICTISQLLELRQRRRYFEALGIPNLSEYESYMAGAYDLRYRPPDD